MEETKELKEIMTEEELAKKYLEAFEFIRGLGFTKNYETLVGPFTMGIAMTKPPKPVGKEDFDAKIDELMKTRPYELPENLSDELKNVVREGDVLRYHRIYFNNLLIHYVFIKNASLGNRVKEFQNPAAISKTIIVDKATIPDDADEKFKSVEMVGMIVIGDTNPAITNVSRGHVLDHEFAHVMLANTLLHTSDEQWETYNNLVVKGLGDHFNTFEEFLCDFTPYDSTVVNRFKVSPIAKFSDAMKEFFKDEVIDAYVPIVKAIAPFYDAMTE